MPDREFPLRPIAMPAEPALHVAAVTLGAIAYATAPTLGPFPGAMVPWPAHGIAAALILGARPPARARVSASVAAALLVGLAPVAMQMEPGAWPARLVAAVALVVAQALVVALLYHRLAGEVSPLDGTNPYARMLISVVVGILPTTAVASVLLRANGGSVAGYSGWAWWTGAATSGITFIGIVLALLPPEAPTGRPPAGRSVELVVMATIQSLALASAFGEMGPFAGYVLPAVAALPFLAWAGMRFGVRGYALIALLHVAWVVGATWSGTGPYAQIESVTLERFRRSWVYLASLVGPAMIFPVALAERAAAERRAREALAQLRALFEGAGDLIAAVDRDLVIIAANPAWRETYERLTGLPFVPGVPVSTLHRGHPEELPRAEELWRRALRGESFSVEVELGAPSRTRELFDIAYAPVRDETGQVVGASHVLRNISDRRRREAEASEQRRVESLGRLAGGVAHDFNNILTAILGNAELLLGTFPEGDERRIDVIEIQNAARRASGLTQQLLAFARRREVLPQQVDIAASVRGMERLLRALLGPAITLEVESAERLPRILIDPTQFEQVVMNLAVNARDAMPQGGTLRIVMRHERTSTGPRVVLTVHDTGEGMPPEVQARVFEPFFTTKPQGKGTGLGLSTVHGIVHQAGGRVALESAPGRGTEFRLSFPAAE